MEIMIEKLTADPLKLVNYPVSDDDAPVRSESSLTYRIVLWENLYRGYGAILTVASIAAFVQTLAMIGHVMSHTSYYEPQPYVPFIPWAWLAVVIVVSIASMLVASRARKSATATRYKLYRSVPQGRIVKMDMFGDRPHVSLEGRNSRNEIRTEWHLITVGEWENWLFKYMKRGIYVDFRVQDDAGE